MLNPKDCLILFISVIISFVSCSHDIPEYTSLIELYACLSKNLETQRIHFGNKNRSDEKHLLEGWGRAREAGQSHEVFRWGIGKESSLLVHFSELNDKQIVMECRPFNPPKTDRQAADVYINGNYLEHIGFTNIQKEYTCHIPESFLSYGSNIITFKWQHVRAPVDFGINDDYAKLAVRFSRLWIGEKNEKYNEPDDREKISLIELGSDAAIAIPRGGVLEYYLDLPADPVLKFGLNTRGGLFDNPKIGLAVYNHMGEKIIFDIDDEDLKKDEFQVKLDRFAGENVKVVFSNSINNHQDFMALLKDPCLYCSSPKKLPICYGLVDGYSRPEHKITAEKQEDAPNVFVYLIDTLRADHLSCYGYPRKTSPCIDKFSEEALVFRYCFATASWTKPTVASILTGLYPNKHQAERAVDRLSGDVLTFSEIFKAQGYTTVFISTNEHITDVFNFDQGNDFYIFERYWLDSSRVLNEKFFQLINDNPDLMEKPIFGYFHTFDPHEPYTPVDAFRKFGEFDEAKEELCFSANLSVKEKKGGLDQADIDYIKSLYDCEILQNDHYFGKFLEFLKDKDLYENSIIILVADHGEQFKEHGGLLHGSSIYNEEIHIPLIVKFPHGENGGSSTRRFVSQVDIFPTVMDYLGIDTPQRTDGMSFFQLRKERDLRRKLFIKQHLHWYNFVGFVDTGDKMKQITTYKDKTYTYVMKNERYGLEKDFQESSDLFVAENPFHLNSINFKIHSLLGRMEKSALMDEEKVDYDALDKDFVERLKALGYIK